MTPRQTMSVVWPSRWCDALEKVLPFLVVSLLLTACAFDLGPDARPRQLTLIVEGLPPGARATLSEYRPAPEGGFILLGKLVTTTDTARAEIEGTPFVGADPVEHGNERWMADPRFQRVSLSSDTVRFRFQHEYAVTVSWGGHGAADPGSFGQPVGAVTPLSGWMREGDVVTFRATPAAGWRFTHWGIFEDGERTDLTRDNGGTDPVLTLTITRPLTLAAEFVR